MVKRVTTIIAGLALGLSTWGTQAGEDSGWHCLTQSQAPPPAGNEFSSYSVSQVLRTFRIAVVAAGEFTEFHGGTVEGARAAIVTTINRINQIYEPELGVRLVLIPNNDLLIYTNKNTDPFTANDYSMETIQQCQAVLDQKIGTANYDLGIAFNTGLYGLAYIRSVCDPAIKGSACVGKPVPTGELFYIHAAHEIAHQFGANHTFNSPAGFCNDPRNAPTAVEPGAGSTLMSYAGLACGDDSWQPLMNSYFSAVTLAEIQTFLQSSQTVCAGLTPLTNHAPVVQAPGDCHIPKSTPFQLTAVASDADGDPITFCWEQMDLGGPQTLGEPDNGVSPLFRSYPPTTNASRVFPRLDAILADEASPGEKLPVTDRLLRFCVTVRDGTGAFAWAETHLNVENTAGPFRVTSHNTAGVFTGPQTVTWNVAGTTQSPINVSSVDILLSTNGGMDFPVVLAGGTANDGSEVVTFPLVNTTQGRIKIQSVGNVFFNVNEANLTLSPEFLSITSFTVTNHLHLRWHHRPGKNYKVQATTDMNEPSWEDLSINLTTIQEQMEAVVPMNTGARRYFRVYEF